MHLDGDDSQQDEQVIGLLKAKGTISYPKVFPRILFEELELPFGLRHDVFAALKRLEKSDRIVRTVEVTRPKMQVGAAVYPPSRVVTIQVKEP